MKLFLLSQYPGKVRAMRTDLKKKLKDHRRSAANAWEAFSVIYARCNGNKETWWGQNQLLEDALIGRDAFLQGLTDLKDLGLIEVTRREANKMNSTNLYRLTAEGFYTLTQEIPEVNVSGTPDNQGIGTPDNQEVNVSGTPDNQGTGTPDNQGTMVYRKDGIKKSQITGETEFTGTPDVSPIGEHISPSGREETVGTPEVQNPSSEKAELQQRVHELSGSYEELSKYDGYVIKANTEDELDLKRTILEMVMTSKTIPGVGSPRKKIREVCTELNASTHDFLDSFLHWAAVQADEVPSRPRDCYFWIMRHAKNYHSRPEVKMIGLLKADVQEELRKRAIELVEFCGNQWGERYTHYEGHRKDDQFWQDEITSVEVLMKSTGSSLNELKVLAVACTGINHYHEDWQSYYDGEFDTFQWDKDAKAMISEANELRDLYADFGKRLTQAEEFFGYKLPNYEEA